MKIITTWGSNRGQKFWFRIEFYVKSCKDEGQKKSSGKLSQLEGQNFMSRGCVPLIRATNKLNSNFKVNYLYFPSHKYDTTFATYFLCFDIILILGAILSFMDGLRSFSLVFFYVIVFHHLLHFSHTLQWTNLNLLNFQSTWDSLHNSGNRVSVLYPGSKDTHLIHHT